MHKFCLLNLPPCSILAISRSRFHQIMINWIFLQSTHGDETFKISKVKFVSLDTLWLWTKVLNKIFEPEWWKKNMNRSWEQKSWRKVVSTSWQQKLWTKNVKEGCVQKFLTKYTIPCKLCLTTTSYLADYLQKQKKSWVGGWNVLEITVNSIQHEMGWGLSRSWK